jgi:hypothetical protein
MVGCAWQMYRLGNQPISDDEGEQTRVEWGGPGD